MKVLVVGSGGREHALAWKIRQSSQVTDVFVAPGNAGTNQDAVNIDIAATDIAGIVDFVRSNKVDLTVVGPEVPLCAGLSDAIRDEGFRVFGPSKAAAALEGSKIECKKVLTAGQVPTANYEVFRSAEEGEAYLNEEFEGEDEVPVVIKADGLAAGKGAIVCKTREDAFSAIDLIARQKAFGDAGKRYIIEEKLFGHEASVLAITDGRTILTLPPAQDHKAAFDNDEGPNTGGMGAYCPTKVINEETMRWTERNVLVPTVHVMNRQRRPFSGILYAGLMITGGNPKVLEYNVRFGDPECQPLLFRLKTDIVDVFEATIDKNLEHFSQLEWDSRPAVCVVMASEGYPNAYEKGHVIRGLAEAEQHENVKVFHAGTTVSDSGEVVTNGGRVLGVTAMGESIAEAKKNAYAAVRTIRWNGGWCRKDISDKALVTT